MSIPISIISNYIDTDFDHISLYRYGFQDAPKLACRQCAGVPVCAGVSVCRCVGVSVCRCIGATVCRCVGVLACRRVGLTLPTLLRFQLFNLKIYASERAFNVPNVVPGCILSNATP